MPRDPRYMILAALSKLVISCIFWLFSWAIVHGFRVPGGFPMPRDPRYMTLAASSKPMLSGIFCRFRGL